MTKKTENIAINKVAVGVMGKSDYRAEPRFSLASKSTVHNRAVH